jgi:GNAT superfamily N-acetyltransferase
MGSAEDDLRRLGVIWVLDLDETAPWVSPLLRASFERAGKECAALIGTAFGGDTTAGINARFETGRRCFAAWVEGTLAAYGWVSFEEEYIGELGLRITLLPGEAYIWDCATLPAYRHHLLYSALLSHILEELRREKLCRVWIGADFDNVPSQRGIARAGFHPVADMVVDRASDLDRIWVQGRPGVPESLVTQARRAFLGDRDRI